MSIATPSEIINRAWKLVVDQGHSRASAARLMGITEVQINRIVNALHSRRKKTNTPPETQALTGFLNKPRLLLLDDDAIAGELTQLLLTSGGLDADFLHASSRGEFVEALERADVDIVISDSSMFDIHPLEALKLARVRHPACGFFILSAKIHPARAAEAAEAGVLGCIDKLDTSSMVALIKAAVRKPLLRH